MDYRGFHGEGQWYKGNLHCHTTISDGNLTPEEVVDLYKSHGYSFLAISDHNIYTDFGSSFNSEDFVILPAVEAAAVLVEREGSSNCLKTHHIHGILAPSAGDGAAASAPGNCGAAGEGHECGSAPADTAAAKDFFAAAAADGQNGAPLEHMEEVPTRVFAGQWDGAAVAQALSDDLRARSCITIYNHPIWSRVRESEFIHTTGLTALEIYNYNTVNESGTGYDTTYWDVMLREGKKIWGVASDDNHNTEYFEDSCGGFIVVKAPKLSREDITQAIVDGNYYSSSGPEIYDWGIHDQVAYVTCSPVERVNFIAGNYVGAGATVLSEDGSDSVDYALLRLRGDETYVRVECVDSHGRTAWSNPIFLERP